LEPWVEGHLPISPGLILDLSNRSDCQQEASRSLDFTVEFALVLASLARVEVSRLAGASLSYAGALVDI